jgi:glycosyltransferase involved in cell wall biosynthesis
MQTLVLWHAAAAALLAVGVFVELARSARAMRRLTDIPSLDATALPATSVVIAARNEAAAIEPALRSVLALHGATEVVVVDDRSDDGTGEILDRMAEENPRLRVLHVRELPAGWLGKTHALQVGADAARGELLLFTDADVVMAPDTLLRAGGHLVRDELDHVAVAPRVPMPGVLLQAFGIVFGIFFLLWVRPWRIRDPRAANHVGVGAFNLVRADAYRRAGAHHAIAMRPDDDVKLGKVIRKHGGAQELVDGGGLVSVEWYATLGEAVRGLRKNGFAGVDYRVWVVVLATAVHLAFFVAPFAGVLLAGGGARLLYLAAASVLLVVTAAAAVRQGSSPFYGLLFPFCTLLFLLVLWNATLYALVNRGIEWRGTHYPLDALKANRV